MWCRWRDGLSSPDLLESRLSAMTTCMSDSDEIRQRTREAAHLQLIEGNPLDAEQTAMFEMFDREGFSAEQELAYVLERARGNAATQAAE